MNRKETGQVCVALIVVFNIGCVAGFYCGDYNKIAVDDVDRNIKDKISKSFFLGMLYGVGYEKYNTLEEDDIINELEYEDDIFYECYLTGKNNLSEITPYLEYAAYHNEIWYKLF